MEKNYSLDAFNEFLDYTLLKGILKPETAKSRKVAANKILEKVTPDERADLRLVNLDVEAERFANRQGNGYLAASLKVYKSRAKSALSDFFSYVENRMAFRPSVANRGAGKPSKGSAKRSGASPGSSKIEAPAPASVVGAHPAPALPSGHDNLMFPIPIRPGLIVKLTNIPADLTAAEAEKIAQVIKALACNE